ncbi:MAG TPA: GTPase, partial [Thermofilum sp.]|nr:GTPase [Thermofilum sp.]
MRLTAFVLGPAGSGKTTFVASFSQWAYNESIPVLTLNLDPAAEDLPYIPDIDIREYLTAREVMERYELGPNGAIVASMDLILNYVEKLRSGVEDE